ncbi:hypothetical protein Ciccas_006547 [Cichlidogyrus casuarinus]|uniref:Uncharacterized protein n=1 Tax=Cichlidogyrus casuarinus TaxID=1844966 RepID=A0ABD2Q5F1_9PLAT
MPNGVELKTSKEQEIVVQENLDVSITKLVLKEQPSRRISGDYSCKITGEIIDSKTGRRESKTIVSNADIVFEGEN